MQSDNSDLKKLNSDECISKWKSEIRQDRSRQYLFRDRKEHLRLLMGYFISNDIGMEEATVMKRKAVEALVHTEGMKGQGKYKDWKKTVEEDYDDWIQLTYVPSLEMPEAEQVARYDQKPEIVVWAKGKFGNDISQQMLKECHQIGNTLHIMFVDHLMKEG